MHPSCKYPHASSCTGHAAPLGSGLSWLHLEVSILALSFHYILKLSANLSPTLAFFYNSFNPPLAFIETYIEVKIQDIPQVWWDLDDCRGRVVP